jgi:mRNA interferase ChpB
MVTAKGFTPRVNSAPARGDVLMLQFNPVVSGEMPDEHPAVVMTDRSYNNNGLAIVCGISSKEYNNPFTVFVPTDLKLGFDGFVHVDQVRLVNYRQRNPRRLGRMPDDLMGEITLMLRDLIDPVP